MNPIPFLFEWRFIRGQGGAVVSSGSVQLWKNGNQELILRETGRGKRSHRSSTHLSSTHFPTTILNSSTASPRGQAHHVMCGTTVPEKRAIPGRPLSGDLH